MNTDPIKQGAKRAWALAQIVSTIASAGHPPANMPANLAKQYKDSSTAQRAQRPKDIRRLTSKDRAATPALDKGDLKRLRGK